MKPIRNAVKAIICRGDEVLTIRCDCKYDGDVCYSLPGGGQEPDELMHETALRECLEEIGCPVQVGPLLYVCEYVGEGSCEHKRGVHQIEFLFQCTLPDGVEPRQGDAPDEGQVGVEWVPLDTLDALRHFPKGLVAALKDPNKATVYWGNVNY